MRRPLLAFVVLEGIVVLVLGMLVVMRGRTAVEVPGGVPVVAVANRDTANVDAERAPIGVATPTRGSQFVAGEPATAVLPGDPLGLVLYGTVRSTSGKALPGSRVHILGDGVERSADRSETGRWSLAGVAPGRYTLRCACAEHATLEREVELSPAPRVQRHDLVLEAKPATTVDLRLVDAEGVALTLERIVELFGSRFEFDQTGIVVTAEPLPRRIPLDEFGRPVVRKIGDFRAAGSREEFAKCAGQVVLAEPASAHVSVQRRGFVLAAGRLEPGQDAVTLELDLAPKQLAQTQGSVRLRVVEAGTQEPVPDVYVRVGSPAGPPDAQGVVLRTLAPGHHVFEIFGGDRYARVAGAFLLEPGQDLDLGTVELHAGRSWPVVVVDEAGRGVGAHLVLCATGTGNPRRPVVDMPIGQARSDGRFELERVAERPFVLRAVLPSPGVAGHVVFDGSRPVEELRIVVRPARWVRLKNGLGPYQTADVVVKSAEGDPLWAEGITPRSRRGPYLPTGSYRVETFTDGGIRTRTLIVAPDGATLEVP